MFIKSVASGQVYKVDAMPKFSAGWVVVSEKEYIAYCQKMGIQ